MLAPATPVPILPTSYLPKASAFAWQFGVGIWNPVLLRTEIDLKYLRPLVFLSKQSNTQYFTVASTKNFSVIIPRLLDQ